MIVHTLFDLLAVCGSSATFILLYRWRYRAATGDIATKVDSFYPISLGVGAIGGAYILGTLNLYLSGHEEIGRSILGALIGAILMVEIYKLRHNISTSTGFMFALPFAVSTMIGRWGCYFSGLKDETYGIPTSLPWGVMYEDGVLRHPVPLYESGAMGLFAVFAIILLRYCPHFFIRYGFYMMTFWYGLQRFVWEFLKPYAAVWGAFNIFHIACLILIIYSVIMMVRGRKTGHECST